ncbi:unnamed protein product [Effrenium voratum]|nr:unnamed protein product [Effrenium voratum]
METGTIPALKHPGDIIDQALAYTSFMSWCKSKNLYSSCKPWDRLLDFDMSKLSDFPESIRGKGYDTGLGCKWLADILSSQDLEADAELKTLHRTAVAINRFFSVLHAHGVVLPNTAKVEAGFCLQRFVEGYCILAAQAARGGKRRFKLRPKLHLVMEVQHELAQPCNTSVSPLAAACWSDEDFIGRLSRLSRSCHSGMLGLSLTIRTMQKALAGYKVQFRRFEA